MRISAYFMYIHALHTLTQHATASYLAFRFNSILFDIHFPLTLTHTQRPLNVFDMDDEELEEFRMEGDKQWEVRYYNIDRDPSVV